MLELRRYTADDFEAFVAVQSRAFSLLASQAYTLAELAALEASRRTDARRSEMLTIDEFVAVTAAGAIVGAAGFTPQPGEAGTARIRRVFVDPDFAGRGLGKRLVGAAEARARDAGFSRFVVCASLNAVSFYARLGYASQHPEIRDYDGVRVEFSFMRRRVAM